MAIILLTGLLIWLIDTDENVLQKKQPSGELVRSEDVRLLIDEMVATGTGQFDENAWKNLKETYFTMQEEHFQYGIYEDMIDCLLGKVEPQAAENIKKQLTYKDKYRDDFYLLKEDWYQQYRVLLEFFGLQEFIKEETIEILCSNEELTGAEQIGENCLLGKTGLVYENVSKDMKDLKLSTAKVYLHGNKILTLLEKMPQENVLSNVYILDASEQGVRFFYTRFITISLKIATLQRQYGKQPGYCFCTTGNRQIPIIIQHPVALVRMREFGMKNG